MALSLGFAPVKAFGAGTSALSITTTAIGDAVVMFTSVSSTAIAARSITSNNIAWDSNAFFTSTADGVHTLQLWKGVTTSIGAASATVGWSTAISSTGSELSAMGVHCDALSNWVWATAAITKATAVTSYSWPALTALKSDAGEAYLGYVADSTTAVAGSTSGFTYSTDSNGNMNIYNLALAAGSTYTPAGSASSSGNTFAIGGILRAVYFNPGLQPQTTRWQMTNAVNRASFW